MFLAPAIASGLAGVAGQKILKAIGLKDGGRIKKEGLYHLHAGEMVVPAHIVGKNAPATNLPKGKAFSKGTASKTMKGRKDFTTKATSKDFDRGGKRSTTTARGVSKQPYQKRKRRKTKK
mgnify:CR=1 FL=1|tara:strand:+ start:917 stop:1276 length:360 start_codon:yes stop_codon:yes gene_type:complete